MKRWSLYVFAVAFIMSAISVSAQTNGNAQSDIFTRLSQSGNVTVMQPEAMAKRFMVSGQKADNDDRHSSDQGQAHAGSIGYRIQVFSDANASTAKAEAQSKEQNLLSRFPTLSTYLTYKAPSWRLRVGDFINREEAEEMMREIKNAFPSYSRELIIVRDKITPSL